MHVRAWLAAASVALAVFALAARLPAQQPPVDPAFQPGEVLIHFEDDATRLEQEMARQAAGAERRRLVSADENGELELAAIDGDVADAVAALSAQAGVRYAEPNWLVTHQATANDPFYLGGQLWGMLGPSSSPANPFGVSAADMWLQGHVGASNVYVAVIDEGIDVNHPDLAANIWTNPFDAVDGKDNDGNGFVDDVRGWDFFYDDNSVYDGASGNSVDAHGTHVAGTIGGVGGNGTGVVGVNWRVGMIPAKFLGPYGGYTADAVAAVNYVVDLKKRHGLKIVAMSNSWGGGGYSQALHDAIIRAAKQDILFIAAAGNSNRNNDLTPNYPSSYSTRAGTSTEAAAEYESVIAVAAIQNNGARASFSSYGLQSVDLGAPGVGVWSTVPGNAYASYSGTSMATPHVSGAAALFASMHPSAGAEQIRTAILDRGVPTASMAGVTVTGARLSLDTFTYPPPPPGPPPSISINDVSVHEGHSGTSTATFTVSLSAPAVKPVSVNFATADGSARESSTTRRSTSAVTIPASATVSGGAATPYPSSIVVPSIPASAVTKVTVRLENFSHRWTSDVDVLLVGPGGQTVMLMSDVGGSSVSTGLTLTFDDSGPALGTSTVASGTYRPTNSGSVDPFPAPAPPAPYGGALSVFAGKDPAGTWRLYAVDDVWQVDHGSLGAWSVTFHTTANDYHPSTGTLTFTPGTSTRTLSVPVIGDVSPESDETFVVNLSNPINATIGDAQGVATILNDDLIDSVSLSSHVAAPQVAGTPITFTATATGGGAAGAQFKWFVFDGAQWQAQQGWGSRTFTWTPYTGNARYRVGVWARSDGVTADRAEATDARDFPISAPPPVRLSVATSPAAPGAVGAAVTFTASATGGLAPYQYRWWLFDGASWIAQTGWTGPTFTWMPYWANANYRIGVWVRSAGATSDLPGDAVAIPFPVPSAPLSASIAPSVAAPQEPGSTITFVATSSGGIGTHQYRWFVWDGAAWQPQQGWGGPVFRWTASAANTQTRVRVWVRGSLTITDTADATATLDFPIAWSSPPAVQINAASAPPQLPGTPVAFTAVPSGGRPPYRFKWSIWNGMSWQAQTGWESSPSWSWIPGEPNEQLKVSVQMRSGAVLGDGADASAELPYPIRSATPVQVTSLTSSTPAPHVPGTPITFLAAASGGSAPYAFKWWIFENGRWSMLRDWGGPALTWTPAQVGEQYQVGVWVRGAGVTADTYEVVAAQPFAVRNPGSTPSTPVQVSLQSDRTSPQRAGATVTFVASATGGTGPHQFKWWIHDGVDWRVQSGWGGPVFSWAPGVARANYQVGVWVRNASSAADAPDHTTAMPFAITDAPRVRVVANRPSPQPPDASITFTAGVLGASQYRYNYQFWLSAGGAYSLLRDWGGPMVTWRPAAPGTYSIRAVASGAGSPPAELFEMPFTVAAASAPAVVSLVANRPAPQVVGTPIMFTATASGGTGPYEYRWTMTDPIMSIVVQDWGGPVLTWLPQNANAHYRMNVDVRAAGVVGERRSIPFPVYDKLPEPIALSITTDRAAPQPAGTTVTFTAAVSGGQPPYEFKWWLFTGTEWVVVQEWGGPTLAWRPTQPNPNYRIGAWVRPAGSTADTYAATVAIPYPVAVTTADSSAP